MLWSVLILVRFIIATPIVLVVPGIVLQLALFPRAQFDAAERAFMILSGSVALGSLVAVLLAWSPLGLHVWSFGLFLALVVGGLGLVAAVRHDGRHAARATIESALEFTKAPPRRAVARRNVEIVARCYPDSSVDIAQLWATRLRWPTSKLPCSPLYTRALK